MAAGTAEQPARYALGPGGLDGILSIDALDKRTRPYRRYETIRGNVLADMGGADNTSEVQRQLISKFATLALQLEVMEAAAIAGDTIDMDVFGRASGHLRRIAETLGLRRVPHDVTPNVHDYLRSIAEEEAAQ